MPSIAATQETSGRLLVGGTVGPIRPTPLHDESREEEDDIFIEVSVSSPQKMGEGMSSYLAYKVRLQVVHKRTTSYFYHSVTKIPISVN